MKAIRPTTSEEMHSQIEEERTNNGRAEKLDLKTHQNSSKLHKNKTCSGQ
jgi:hypothetical protein